MIDNIVSYPYDTCDIMVGVVLACNACARVACAASDAAAMPLMVAGKTWAPLNTTRQIML